MFFITIFELPPSLQSLHYRSMIDLRKRYHRLLPFTNTLIKVK